MSFPNPFEMVIYAGATVLLLLAFLSLRRIPFSSILGIGVVIAVMLSMKALDHGVELATQSSASKDLLIVMREGSEAEISSFVTKDATAIIRALPGASLISPEIAIIFKLPRAGAPKGSNVLVRGVTPAAFEVRPYTKIVEGRMFRPA